MNHRNVCVGFFGFSIALCTALMGCPKQDAQVETQPESILAPRPPCVANIDCDDGNPCTVDACNGTTLRCDLSPLDNVATPLAPQTECLEHVCIMGVDTAVPAAQGVAVATQVAGDCKMTVCDGMGGEMVIGSLQDVKIDGLECTRDICDNGMPRHINEPDGKICGGSGANTECVAGQCVGCSSNAECAAGATVCTDAVCSGGSCQSQPKPNNTRLPPPQQTAGDCKARVCDGNGNTKEIADPMDPENDGNACTLDTCNGTIPTHEPAPVGTICNGNLLCNGAGSCGGAIGDTCTANAACSSGFCVDGVCCNTACTADCKSCDVQGSVGTCSNAPFYATDGTCGGTKVCDGQGACKLANGEKCAGGADNCASGVCGQTICKALPGQACTGNKDCASGDCISGICQ